MSEELENYERLTKVLVRPLKAEVANRSSGDREDLKLHRGLSELLDDGSNLTPFAAGRNADALDGQLEAWFARQSSADEARAVGMVSLIENLGATLKRAKGDDDAFFGQLEKDLDQMKRATGRDVVKQASSRLSSLVVRMATRMERQREQADRRVQQLGGLVQSLNDELRQVRHEATLDPLTGLNNRGSFDAMLDDFLRRSRLAPFRFCLILFDLDFFKAVNDEHGHVVGDEVLAMVGAAVSRVVLRSSDFAARYGGEEFAVLLADSGPERAQKLAEDLRETISKGHTSVEGLVQTASFGVAEGWERDGPVQLIARADACLYKAKQAGRNQVVVAGFGDLGRRVRVPRGVQVEPRRRIVPLRRAP